MENTNGFSLLRDGLVDLIKDVALLNYRILYFGTLEFGELTANICLTKLVQARFATKVEEGK